MRRSDSFLNSAQLFLLAAVAIAAGTVRSAEAPDRDGENERKAPPRLAVRPSTPGNLTPLEELVAGIDNRIESTAIENGVAPAPLCDDFAFLRRVSLDLAGEIPSADAAAAFARSNDPKKRALAIQELMKTPAYADRWANFWTVVLVGPRGNMYGDYYSTSLHDWLFNEMRSDRGMDTIVRAILTSSNNEPAAYLGLRLYRNGVPKTADHLARSFLGARIGCAQCHDHPFDKYTQEDFWGFASFLAYTQSNFSNLTDMDSRVGGEQNEPPSSDYVLAARYLDGTTVDVDLKQLAPPQPPEKKNANAPMARNTGNATIIQGRPIQWTSVGTKLRHSLADLILTRDDLRFDRAIANRVWATLLGRGLIHPIDDIRINSADESRQYGPHDDILNLLAADFRASGRDLRRLLTLITATQAYQRASHTTAKQRERDNAVRYFVQADVRLMTPEMFHLAIARVASGEERYLSQQKIRFEDFARRGRDSKRSRTDYEDQLARFYQRAGPPVDDNPIYMEPSFARALSNMNGDYIQRAAQDGTNRLKQRNRASLEYLFATTLSRPLSSEEHNAFQKLGDKHEAILWILFNSAEFSSIR